MAREFPGVAFERYVDDAVVHCVSEAEAHHVLGSLQMRMREVGLELHPDKTRQVCLKTGKRFTGFNPGISNDALKKLSSRVRSWRLHLHTEVSERISPG